jgi:hypothetical protein
MHLTNTIELEPYKFSNSEYEFPNDSRKKMPEAWHQFWTSCLSDKNLGHLMPVEKGSYMVDMENITEQDLTTIIENVFEDVYAADYEEQLHALCGGIVLSDNNRTYIEPSCCGDLSDLYGWEKIVEAAPDTWTKLWIGHPWIYYRKQNDMIEFSNYTDNEYKGTEALPVLLSVDETSLQQELERMRNQQLNLEEKTRSVLNSMGVNNAAAIAKIITANK